MYPKQTIGYWMSFLAIIFAVASVSGSTLSYLDNYGNGLIKYGPTPSSMDRYATLANDPTGNLPDAFTICSAIYFKYRTSIAVFFQLYQADGSPWINFYMIDSFLEDITDRFKIVFNEKFLNLWPNEVPVVPHSWYRGCLGVDTVTGRIRIYVDGFVVLDEELEYFKGSTAMKPNTLKNNVGVFKSRIPGLYYNARGRVSDIQVHSTLLSADDMIHMTSNNNPNCITEGDYLKWEDMEWNITGEVIEGQSDLEELCESKVSTTVFLPVVFRQWETCMQTCPKMDKSRAPSIINQDEMDSVSDLVRKITFKDGKIKPGLRTNSIAYWLPISDISEEGTWIDYYNQEQTQLFYFHRLDGLKTVDWTCLVPPTQHIRCVCQHPKKIYLKLRGLCPTSNIDMFFSPSND